MMLPFPPCGAARTFLVLAATSLIACNSSSGDSSNSGPSGGSDRGGGGSGGTGGPSGLGGGGAATSAGPDGGTTAINGSHGAADEAGLGGGGGRGAAEGGVGGSSSSDAGVGGSCVGKGFSDQLDPYARHPTAATKSVDDIFAATAPKNETLTDDIIATRKKIIAMYKDFGIDLSLDSDTFYSDTLRSASPKHFSPQTPQPLSGDYTAPFSIDAPFYHPIPCGTPRVALPQGYFQGAQYNTVHGFDGLGIGVTVAGASDPLRTLTSQPGAPAAKSWQLHIGAAAKNAIPDNASADRHVSFIDSTTQSLLNTEYATEQSDGSWQAGFSPGPQTLPYLGDYGGTFAAGLADLAMLIRPGEATNPTAPIPHAVCGPVNRLWKARVFPAVSGDAWVFADQSTSFHQNGLIPYGAVVQLDPTLNLSSLNLSLPARRVLEAMQTYGFYNVDTGGPDIDFYTSADASEYDAFGGVYQAGGGGVQNEIGDVLKNAVVYVVPPIVKR